MRTMYFFGVRTSGSAALRLFPAWAEALGLGPARLVGVDLPLGAPPAAYRDAVHRLRDEPSTVGALVTSHKLAVVDAAADLIDHLTPMAQRCGEVSALYRRGAALHGHACDPDTCMAALDALLGLDYWARHPAAEILCLGAGGAAVALVAGLLDRPALRQPARITLVDPQPERLAHVEALVAAEPQAPQFELQLVEGEAPADNDRLLAGCPPGTLVINATGLGKDRPGSPLSATPPFPANAIAWELNYRGPRPFLHHAQQGGLQTADGWPYFLRGWYTVIGLVYACPASPAAWTRFVEVAALHRPSPLL